MVADKCRRKSHQPVADEGVNHRCAGIVDAAQDAGGADLHAVADLEEADQHEDAAGDGDDFAAVAVKGGDVLAEEERQHRHEQHDDGNDDDAADGAAAQGIAVAAAVGVAAADSIC